VKRDSPAVSSVRVKAKTPAFHRYGEGINLAQGSHNDWNEGVLGHEEYPFRRGAIHFHPPRHLRLKYRICLRFEVWNETHCGKEGESVSVWETGLHESVGKILRASDTYKEMACQDHIEKAQRHQSSVGNPSLPRHITYQSDLASEKDDAKHEYASRPLPQDGRSHLSEKMPNENKAKTNQGMQRLLKPQSYCTSRY